MINVFFGVYLVYKHGHYISVSLSLITTIERNLSLIRVLWAHSSPLDHFWCLFWCWNQERLCMEAWILWIYVISTLMDPCKSQGFVLYWVFVFGWKNIWSLSTSFWCFGPFNGLTYGVWTTLWSLCYILLQIWYWDGVENACKSSLYSIRK